MDLNYLSDSIRMQLFILIKGIVTLNINSSFHFIVQVIIPKHISKYTALRHSNNWQFVNILRVAVIAIIKFAQIRYVPAVYSTQNIMNPKLSPLLRLVHLHFKC